MVAKCEGSITHLRILDEKSTQLRVKKRNI